MDKTIRAMIIFLALAIIFAHSEKIYAADFQDYYIEESYEGFEEPEENFSPSPEQVTLNADRVSFNDETGQAYAEGNAILTYQDTTIKAERIEYDADTQKVDAMPMPGEKIIMTNKAQVIRGDRLNYDLNTQEGILTGAAVRVPVGDAGGTMYVYGNEINVIPWDIAVERGLVKGKPQEYIIEWKDVLLTTCALEHPHYRLEAKVVSFVPGKSVTAHKPRIFLGNTYLFTLPFDYVAPVQRKPLRYTFFPYYQKSEEKGTTGGITGTLGWATGRASLGFSYSDKAHFEFMAEIEQELNDDFTLTVGTEHSWDELWNDKVWRPYSSLHYHHNGWDAFLNWSRNEFIEDQKDSTNKYEGRLDRRPEFIGWAPWFRNFPYSWMRININVGSYKETMYDNPEGEVTTRYGTGFRNYYERFLNPLGSVSVFLDTEGLAWFYDRDQADHEMLRNFLGLRYVIGALELGSGFERQYTANDFIKKSVRP